MTTMHRLALLLVLSLCSSQSGVMATNNLRANSSTQQRRELGIFSWWTTLLNHLHPACPPHHPHCHSHSSSSYYNSTSGQYTNYTVDQAEGMSYNEDGIEGGDGSDVGTETNDDYTLTYTDHASGAGNGWQSKALDNGSGSFMGTHSSTGKGIGAFLAAAMVAGVVGAAVVAARKKRNSEDEDDQNIRQNRMSAIRRRMRGKKNTLVDGAPAFVEITTVGNNSRSPPRSPGSPGSAGSDGSYVEMTP